MAPSGALLLVCLQRFRSPPGRGALLGLILASLVLPFLRTPLPASALVIGSLAPDLPYYVPVGEPGWAGMDRWAGMGKGVADGEPVMARRRAVRRRKNSDTAS